MKRWMRTQAKRQPTSLGLALIVVIACSAFASNKKTYEAQIKQWRAERDAELKADDGWLTLAGLFWLKEGDNRIGSDTSGDIILPEGTAPARLGRSEEHTSELQSRQYLV